MLNTDVQVGHDSTGWCNLANIAFQTGKAFSKEDAKGVQVPEWTALVEEMESHLKAHSLDISKADLKLSQMLTIDPKTQRFVGEGSEAANKFMKREYRAPFVVPEQV